MMAKSMVVTCDKCGEAGASSYVVSVDDDRWHVDLCDDDAGPLRLTVKYGRRGVVENDVRPATQRILEGRIRGVGGAE